MAEQRELFFWNNQNLFSSNYLERRLPTTPLWKTQKENISDVLDQKKAYAAVKPLRLGPGEVTVLQGRSLRLSLGERLEGFCY